MIMAYSFFKDLIIYGAYFMLMTDTVNYLMPASFILLLFITIVMQIRTKMQVCKELNRIQDELKQTNKILASIAGIEDNLSNQTTSYQPNENKVYVGNIGYSLSEADLQKVFAKFGQIEFVNIPLNKHNGKSRGYGFITFKSAKDAVKATQLNGSDINGRQIQVNFAKERM
jgi:hypothetical protein